MKKRKKVILITGATSGIGAECASHLAGLGHIVYGTFRRENMGIRNFNTIEMNVDDSVSVKNGIDYILSKENRIDVLVNNAGFGIAGPIELTSVEEARAQFETNFFGVLRLCKYVLPIMRKQSSGYIINISSIGGLIAIPFQGLYSASKFALEGLTESLRMELKQFGINVTLIEPGDFNTNFSLNRMKVEALKEDSIYPTSYSKALEVMEHDEKNGPLPVKVAYLLDEILNNSSPKLRYMTGPVSEKAAVFLKRFLPSAIFEWAMMKYYRLI